MTALRFEVIDFSYSFYVDSSLFILGLNMETDIWKIIRPLHWHVWAALMITIPLYWLAMCLADVFFEGEARWYRLGLFTLLPLITQSLTTIPNTKQYKRTFTAFWLVGALVLTNAYAGEKNYLHVEGMAW